MTTIWAIQGIFSPHLALKFNLEKVSASNKSMQYRCKNGLELMEKVFSDAFRLLKASDFLKAVLWRPLSQKVAKKARLSSYSSWLCCMGKISWKTQQWRYPFSDLKSKWVNVTRPTRPTMCLGGLGGQNRPIRPMGLQGHFITLIVSWAGLRVFLEAFNIYVCTRLPSL